MPVRWVKRKAHPRNIGGGKSTWIPETWVPYDTSKTSKLGIVTAPCPSCGTITQSRRMPNGGWGHFEADGGLRNVKHACFYRGDGLSKKRDTETADMFLEESEES